MAAILASVQYFPQIYTTFRLKAVASLSIPMMCIQTPGGYVWAASLAARLGREGWSTWGIFVITATLQGVMLVLAIYYEYINPQKGRIDLGHGSRSERQEDTERVGPASDAPDTTASEETPLLRDSG